MATIIVSIAACLETTDALAAQDLADQLQVLIERHGLPGMAAVVLSGSDIVARGATGVRERGKAVKITINDEFHLGSETKAMTATLAAVLVKNGKLRWETSLAESFPDLEGNMLPEYRHVTLKQLLTQRSGFSTIALGDPEVMQKLDTFQTSFPGTPSEWCGACVKALLAKKSAASRSNQFAYSNANYVVAGHMLEVTARQPFEELMHERLFVPLCMTSAGFGPPGHADAVDQPRGHLADGRSVQPQDTDADNPRLYGPSGGVHCSLLDWAKFTAFHATQGESQPGLLNAESFAVLHAPVKMLDDSNLEAIAPGAEGYAMGWFVFPGGVLTHSGTNLRWFAQCALRPSDHLSVLVVCNEGGDHAENACLEAVRDLVHEYQEPRPTK